jgi:hypothetical protein
MRKTYYCPKCDEEPLSVIHLKEWARILCQECGWGYTFAPRPTEEELDGKIAQAVTEAKVAAE